MPLATWLDLLIVALLAAVGAYAFVESWNIRPGFGQVLGADAYPRIVAGVLILLCLAYLAGLALEARRLRAARSGGASGDDRRSIPILQDWHKARWMLAQVWVAFLAYIVLVPVLGYFLASFLFLAVTIFSLGYQEAGVAWLWRSVGYATAIILLLWALLDRFLGLFLPQGFWN
jgi:hypothetical protein